MYQKSVSNSHGTENLQQVQEEHHDVHIQLNCTNDVIIIRESFANFSGVVENVDAVESHEEEWNQDGQDLAAEEPREDDQWQSG